MPSAPARALLERYGSSPTRLRSGARLPRDRPRQPPRCGVPRSRRLRDLPPPARGVSGAIRGDPPRLLPDAQPRAPCPPHGGVVTRPIHAEPPAVVHAALQPAVLPGGPCVPGAVQGAALRDR